MIKVDCNNPAEFLACCGLLELSWHFWPAMSTGSFDTQHESFTLHVQDVSDPIKFICDEIAAASLVVTTGTDLKEVFPATFTFRNGSQFTLDWWCKYPWDNKKGKNPNIKVKQSSRFKMWAGTETLGGILKGMKPPSKSLRKPSKKPPKDNSLHNSFKICVSRPINQHILNRVEPSSTFYLDPCSAYVTNDLGYSPNTAGIKATTYPVRELLAAFGLQRFRPISIGNGWCYNTWTIPLSAPDAMAAEFCGFGTKYWFQIVKRSVNATCFDYSYKKEVNYV